MKYIDKLVNSKEFKRINEKYGKAIRDYFNEVS